VPGMAILVAPARVKEACPLFGQASLCAMFSRIHKNRQPLKSFAILI
jgi:hypothetical protein